MTTPAPDVREALRSADRLLARLADRLSDREGEGIAADAVDFASITGVRDEIAAALAAPPSPPAAPGVREALEKLERAGGDASKLIAALTIRTPLRSYESHDWGRLMDALKDAHAALSAPPSPSPDHPWPPPEGVERVLAFREDAGWFIAEYHEADGTDGMYWFTDGGFEDLEDDPPTSYRYLPDTAPPSPWRRVEEVEEEMAELWPEMRRWLGYFDGDGYHLMCETVFCAPPKTWWRPDKRWSLTHVQPLPTSPQKGAEND